MLSNRYSDKDIKTAAMDCLKEKVERHNKGFLSCYRMSFKSDCILLQLRIVCSLDERIVYMINDNGTITNLYKVSVRYGKSHNMLVPKLEKLY